MSGRNTLYVVSIGVAILFAVAVSAPARRNAQRKTVTPGVERDHPAGATLSQELDSAVPLEKYHKVDDNSKGYFIIERTGGGKRISKRQAADRKETDEESDDSNSETSDDDSDTDTDNEDTDTGDEETDTDTGDEGTDTGDENSDTGDEGTDTSDED
jgi:hypothetical protein